MVKCPQGEYMIKQLFFKFSRRLKLDDIIGYAAQISFYMLVSLVPFTTLLVSALGHFKIIRVDTIISLIQETNIFPSSVMSLLKDTFTPEILMPSNSVPFYVLVVLWFASRGIRSIMNSIHMTFRTRETRSLLRHFLMSFAFTVAFIFLLILFMVMIIFGNNLVHFLSQHYNMQFLVTFLATIIRYFVPLAFLFLFYIVMYKFVPSKTLKVKEVLPGAVFATIASLVVSLVFSAFSNSSAGYSALYGGISSVVILCTWIYLFSAVLIIGSEINACLYEIRNNTTLISIH